MMQYRQVFTFLWRLKRVEHSLTAVWRKHGTAARLMHSLHGDALMHRCHCLRNEMIHFVYNLQYYLMFEVLECSWEELMRQISTATQLDTVIGAHRTFLQAVVEKALLSAENAALYSSLKGLFETILHFSKAQDLLYICLLEHKAMARQHAAAAAANTAQGRWGCSGDVAASQSLQPSMPQLQPHFRGQLLEYASEYKRKFAELFWQVNRHESLDLAFLSFRLDFNLHYSHSLEYAGSKLASEGAPGQLS